MDNYDCDFEVNEDDFMDPPLAMKVGNPSTDNIKLKLLKAYKTEGKATHTFLNNGKLDIPFDKLNEVYTGLSNNPINPPLCERINAYGYEFKFFIDVDDEKADINKIIELVNDYRDQFFILNEEQKQYTVWKNSNKNKYHIIYQFLVDKKDALNIMNLVKKNYPELEVDENVYSVGLRLPLCNKDKVSEKDNSIYQYHSGLIGYNNASIVNTKNIKKTIKTEIYKKSLNSIEEDEENKDNEVNEVKNDINAITDISPLINKMLNVEYKWISEKHDDGFKLTHDSLKCINISGTSHSTLNHSCLFINKKCSTITCFACKPAKKILLKDYPELKNVKIFLGLLQEKKSSEEDKNNDFEKLLYEMLEKSAETKYKKENGWILKPVDGIPTHYEEHLEYTDYLDDLFDYKELPSYKIYRKKVTHKHQLIDYLKTYNKDVELPFIKRDPYMYSFNNGYFNLKTYEFKEFEKDKQYDFCSAVYIKKDFDITLLTTPFDEIKTPLFDKLLKYHVPDNEVYKIILCLIGRLFYQCKEHDTWQCMLFIKGQANTGKSTFLEIIETFFNPRDIGVIGENLEKTFGLQNLCNKRIIISSDIPSKLSEKLEAATLQKMISGENVTVAVKNGDAKHVKWVSTMLMAGNFLPDYSDKAGSISRRFAIVDMGKKVINKDASLKSQILNNEVVSLLVKFIKAYKFYIEKFDNVVFEDWGKKFGIKYFDEAREEFKQETDILYCFLNAPPGANETKSSNIWIECKQGEITPLETFKKSFKTYAKIKHNNHTYKWSNTSDNSTLENLGYEIITIKICASCGKKGQKGCCDNYLANNRRNKVVIKNMVIRNGFDEIIDNEIPEYIYE